MTKRDPNWMIVLSLGLQLTALLLALAILARWLIERFPLRSP